MCGATRRSCGRIALSRFWSEAQVVAGAVAEPGVGRRCGCVGLAVVLGHRACTGPRPECPWWAASVTGGRARGGGLSGRGVMAHSVGSSAVRVCCVVQHGEVAAIDRRETRAYATGVRGLPVGATVGRLSADDSGRLGGRRHSHQLGAQVRRLEDGRPSVGGHTVQRVDRRLGARGGQRRAGRDQRRRLALSAVMRVGEV
jgi:hypothetical protein